MATRSIVSFPTEAGWEGRYVHWDGAPETRLPILNELIARDGYDVVRKTFLDSLGWSSLGADTPDAFDELPEGQYAHEWSREHGRWPCTDPGYGDGRFTIVAGYGTAYTDKQWHDPAEAVFTHADSNLADAEYVYVIHPDGTIAVQ